jgi:predicted dehydrogenase
MPQDLRLLMNKTLYTVGIVGAGRIACGFDDPTSEQVLTHAHAIQRNPRLSLVGVSDTDAVKGQNEAQKWSTTYYADLAEMCSARVPDVLIIATPDDTHVAVLLQALSYKPRLIILEKPVITNPEDAERVAHAAQEAVIPIIVNFRRRFDPRVTALAEALRSGEYGAVLSASALYSKGVVHSGSHIFDLARLFFGEMISSSKLAEIHDWEGEPTVTGFATFERCEQFLLIAGDERAYSLFELDIRTQKKRFRFRDEGFLLETEEVIDDPLFEGYRILGPATSEQTGLIHAMEELATHAVAVLDGVEESHTSLEDALKTDKACRAFL